MHKESNEISRRHAELMRINKANLAENRRNSEEMSRLARQSRSGETKH